MNSKTGRAEFQIRAIRYATNNRRTRNQNFIKDSDPLAPLAMDFYFWALINGEQTILVDTGMSRSNCEKYGHDILIEPVDALGLLGINPVSVETVILTHLHFDHIGNMDKFVNARFLLQAEEMAYATGPHMEKPLFRHAYDAAEINRAVALLHEGRLHLHGREYAVTDGVTVHWVGGHTAGQEVVRVQTSRGWVVLASDALHYEEELTRAIPFSVMFSPSEMLCAHDYVRNLADSDDHIVVAHDPKIAEIYPPVNAKLAQFVFRLEEPPSRSLSCS